MIVFSTGRVRVGGGSRFCSYFGHTPLVSSSYSILVYSLNTMGLYILLYFTTTSFPRPLYRGNSFFMAVLSCFGLFICITSRMTVNTLVKTVHVTNHCSPQVSVKPLAVVNALSRLSGIASCLIVHWSSSVTCLSSAYKIADAFGS